MQWLAQQHGDAVVVSVEGRRTAEVFR